MSKTHFLAAFVLIQIASPALAFRQAPSPNGQLVSSEPARLAYGQTVLVDDKSCPAGQIKQVTGGNDLRRIPRVKECIGR